MNKEDIEVLSKLLTEMKEATGELESATKKMDSNRGNAAKRKILELQLQISKKI